VSHSQTPIQHYGILSFIKLYSQSQFKQTPANSDKRPKYKQATSPNQLIIETAYKYLPDREGKINVCHQIKGHIPLLVYPSFKPYQFNI